MKENIGVFLSRMQPLHNGHIGIMQKALEENDKLIILIGSSNKKQTIRNPLGIEIRRQILEEALEENFGKEYKKKIKIREMPDWTMETDTNSNLEWGRYLYYNIVSLANSQNFTMYFSDDPQIIEKWFCDPDIRKRITLKTFERNKMFQAVSSTKIRQAILKDDKEYIQKSVPNAVIKHYNEIKQTIENVNNDPKEDYIM